MWIDTARIWDGDDAWYAMLADQAVMVPSQSTDRLGGIAREAGVWLVVGINERQGGTIYNTLVYFAPEGRLVEKHRKLMPTGPRANRLGEWVMGPRSARSRLRSDGSVG